MTDATNLIRLVQEIQPTEIYDLAAHIARVVGFDGDFVFDRSKPDGTPHKLVDVGKLAALGWRSRIDFEPGIHDVYRWYQENGTSR